MSTLNTLNKKALLKTLVIFLGAPVLITAWIWFAVWVSTHGLPVWFCVLAWLLPLELVALLLLSVALYDLVINTYKRFDYNALTPTERETKYRVTQWGSIQTNNGAFISVPKFYGGLERIK